MRTALAIQELVFLLTGIFQTLGNQLVFYNGAGGGGMGMITVVPVYMGMAMAGLVQDRQMQARVSARAKDGREVDDSSDVSMVLSSFLEFLAQGFGMAGMMYAGSGLYQVIFSSVVAFTALLSVVFLGKRLTRLQWVGVALVSIGLACSTLSSAPQEPIDSSALARLASHSFASNRESTPDNDARSLFGIVLTLTGTLFFSVLYVVNESLLKRSVRVTPLKLCVRTGLYTLLYTGAYWAAYTLPNWDRLMTKPVEEAKGSWVVVGIMLLALVLASFGHSVTYFALLSEVGSVTTGILNALRAVFVFVLSAVFYCDSHSEQCYTMSKLVSSVIVIGGVLLFSIFSKAAPSPSALPVRAR